MIMRVATIAVMRIMMTVLTLIAAQLCTRKMLAQKDGARLKTLDDGWKGE